MKPDIIIERLFGLLEKLIDRQGPVLDARVTDIERRLAEMEAEWPQIKELQNGTD